jgi:hypothetical protein
MGPIFSQFKQIAYIRPYGVGFIKPQTYKIRQSAIEK